MDYVIDIQGFRDANNRFLPKEVSVISLQQQIVGHWITQPPCNFAELPGGIRKTNSYCSVKVHGLQWFEGDVPLGQLRRNLQDITKSATRIYVRGVEKAKYLESLVGRRIVNLEDYEAPCFISLGNLYPNLPMCTTHGVKKYCKLRDQDQCALRKAHQIKQWFYADVIAKEWKHVSHLMSIPSGVFYKGLSKYAEQTKINLRRHNLSPPEGYDEVDGTRSDSGSSSSSNEDTVEDNYDGSRQNEHETDNASH